MVVHAARILRVRVGKEGSRTTVLFGEKLLDFPGVRLNADGEFEVLDGNGIPVLDEHKRLVAKPAGSTKKTYLINRHNSEQIAHGREEKPVQIMLHFLADGITEAVQKDLAGNEDQDPRDDTAHGPPALERVCDQQQLHDNKDGNADGVQNVEHDEQADGVGRAEAAPPLEGEEGDDERDGEHGHGREAQQPDGERRSVLVQLEPDEPVDEEACAQRGGQAVLDGDEVRERAAARGHNAGVDDERANGEGHVDVEECGDFLAAWGRLLVLTDWCLVSHEMLGREAYRRR